MARMADLKKTLSENVRRLRQDKGLSQASVAFAAGLSVGHVSSIELAKTAVSITVLAQLAEALGVEAADLLKAHSAQKKERTTINAGRSRMSGQTFSLSTTTRPRSTR
jgi:transcriptional regulator with XRE-family HTH domain